MFGYNVGNFNKLLKLIRFYYVLNGKEMFN